MSRILISGVAGFIGSHVAEEALERGHEVYGIDDFSTGKKENIADEVHFKEVDIYKEESKLFNHLRFIRPDTIIHLAAQPSLLISKDFPILDAQTNIFGTLHVIKCCQSYKVKKLVFASTSAVLGPCAPYGISKLAAEYYIQELLDYEQFAILRLGNVYGPRQVPLGENQLIPRCIRHLMFGDDFEIYGDGEDKRDYIYVKDVAKAFLDAENKNAPDFPGNRNYYDICTGQQHRTTGVCNSIADILDMGAYAWEHGEERQSRPHVFMAPWRAISAFGWSPTTTLEEGLRETIRWWQEVSE